VLVNQSFQSSISKWHRHCVSHWRSVRRTPSIWHGEQNNISHRLFASSRHSTACLL